MTKEKYEAPKLALTLLENADIIPTSGNDGPLGWDGSDNCDANGWT